MGNQGETTPLLSQQHTNSILHENESSVSNNRDERGDFSITSISSEPKDDLLFCVQEIDNTQDEDLPGHNRSSIWRHSDKEASKSQASDQDDNLTTVFETFWNICNTIQGLPMLSIPYAFQSGGWLSLAALITIAITSNYTSKILVESLYNYENGNRTRVRSSYMDIGEAFWKKGGKWLVMVMLVIELVFVSTLYPVLVASMFAESNLIPNVPLWGFTFIGGIFLLPNTLLKNLSQVAWTSIITIFCAIIVFVSVLSHSFFHIGQWDIGNMNNFNMHEFPAGVAIIISCHLTQPFVPFIESTMKKPKKFNTSLNWAFMLMTALSVTISVIATLTFYPHIEQVITNNLPDGVFRQLINVVAAILAFTSYTLPMFTCFDIIENSNLPCLPTGFADNVYKIRVQLLRLSLVVLTILMAAFIPHYDNILALVGSISGVTLVFIFPALFHMKIYWEDLKWFQLTLDIIVVFLGTVAMLISLVVSAKSMYICLAHNVC